MDMLLIWATTNIWNSWNLIILLDRVRSVGTFIRNWLVSCHCCLSNTARTPGKCFGRFLDKVSQWCMNCQHTHFGSSLPYSRENNWNLRWYSSVPNVPLQSLGKNCVQSPSLRYEIYTHAIAVLVTAIGLIQES